MEKIPALNLPDVCTASPVRGKAFCSERCQLLETAAPNVPTDLKEFLKFCGTHGGRLFSIIIITMLSCCTKQFGCDHTCGNCSY